MKKARLFLLATGLSAVALFVFGGCSYSYGDRVTAENSGEIYLAIFGNEFAKDLKIPGIHISHDEIDPAGDGKKYKLLLFFEDYVGNIDVDRAFEIRKLAVERGYWALLYSNDAEKVKRYVNKFGKGINTADISAQTHIAGYLLHYDNRQFFNGTPIYYVTASKNYSRAAELNGMVKNAFFDMIERRFEEIK
ncbi:MAG: hypothetical protein LBL66_03935 [Clostridiales bacterium]|jgi:hypothetical protein|nr:hypothetical protein [Clostridiales bacterium]